ncbi:AraC family transcriptional regulator [Pontibacter ummariensis]|uniref:Transcriptional regulator, AraC family n=1 Tax=Pontibacter ummariensis TaxID=1610492 RepID=A0A239BRG8_9BACT|nr:AraC family transcriptional regulator [Pontibacter ummariensis]PRY15674.1 AraC family transcriptional regulator [Pontibacter ummariensis]SNS10242.1 transcriptional regulator, AraC family [Pontibacter ummariensis]
MAPRHILQAIPVRDERSLFTLVENRSAYTLDACELNVFETHQEARGVNLSFGDWVLTSMLRGKKVMHLYDKPGFDYLPGESVIVPPNELMKIDFPEAEKHNPTQCIALAISAEQINSTLQLLNEQYPKVEQDAQWRINQEYFHLANNAELADIINRLIRISLSEHTREKDILAGLALKELLIRLMQTQARHLFEANCTQLSATHRFAHVLQYIKENITSRIDVNRLSDKACMSRASFFRKFKEEFGHTPADFILRERLRLAKKYLQNPANSVTQACYMAGFQNLSYFIRAFKNEVGATPKVFQQQADKTLAVR